MPDEPTTAPDAAATAVDETDPDESALGEPGKKALDAMKAKLRAAEAEVRTLKPLAAKATQLEEANKTEAQRTADALAAATKERDDALSESLRFQVAATKGVKPEDIDLLVGTTREEMEAKADRLIALYGEQGQPRRPSPVGEQGTGGSRSSTQSPRDAFAAYADAKRAGT